MDSSFHFLDANASDLLDDVLSRRAALHERVRQLGTVSVSDAELIMVALSEQYCYAHARLVFSYVEHIEWVTRSACRFTDATGEVDRGNIDALTVDGNLFVVEGDWGMVRIQSMPPRIELKV